MTARDAPTYLPAALKERFAQLWDDCSRMMPVSSLDADLLAKYVLAEDAYLMATRRMQAALSAADPDTAAKWAGIQDRLLSQIVKIGSEFGLVPSARRRRGMTPPR